MLDTVHVTRLCRRTGRCTAVASSQGKENLLQKQKKLVTYGPLFCDITWGAGGSTADATLEISDKMQNEVCACMGMRVHGMLTSPHRLAWRP